jgi:hypothetical protein
MQQIFRAVGGAITFAQFEGYNGSGLPINSAWAGLSVFLTELTLKGSPKRKQENKSTGNAQDSSARTPDHFN